MGIVIPLLGLLFILCFSCAYVGYDVADKRAKQAEQRALEYSYKLVEYQSKLATERMRYEAERKQRTQDIEDYNKLANEYNKLTRLYRNMNNKQGGDVNVQSPVIKEMLRFAMTQAHPDAGKEKTPDRFIKYREEYERLYKGRR